MSYKLQILIDAQNKAQATLDKLQKDIKKLGPVSKKASGDIKKATSSMSSDFSKVRNTVIGVASAIGMFETLKGIAKLTNDLEQNEIAFTTMLGSAEQAQILLRDLSDFAKNTPFELTGIRQNAKQLLAYGIEANNLLPTLKMLGDVSAGLSVPLQQVANAYGQVKVAGRLMGGELLQFTNAGVPLIQELAKNLGVADSEIKKMVADGKIGFKDVEKAFQTMTSEGGKFADLMEKQSKSLGGKWSNLMDNIALLGESIGNKVRDSLKGIIDNINEFLDKNLTHIINIGAEIFNTIIELGKSIFEVGKQIFSQITGIFAMIFGENENTTKGMAESWKKFLLLMSIGVQEALLLINTFVGLVSGAIRSVIGGAKAVGESISLYLEDFWSNVVNNIIGYVNGLIKGINWVLEKVGIDAIPTIQKIETAYSKSGGVMSNVGKAVANEWKKSWDVMKEGNQKIALGIGKTMVRFEEDFKGTGKTIKGELKNLGTSLDTITDTISDGTGKTTDKLKELGREAEKAIKPVLDGFKDNSKAIKDLENDISKLIEKFNEFKQEGARSILDINKELKDLKTEASNIEIKFKNDKVESLKERFKTLKDEIKDINKELLDLGDGKNLNTIKNLSKHLKEDWLRQNKNADFGGGIKGEDILKYIELTKQKAEKEKEIEIIKKNTTTEQLKQIENNVKLTETEKILLQLQEEKKKALDEINQKQEALLEKKKLLELQASATGVNDIKIQLKEEEGILKAYYENKKGDLVEVKDYENVLLAESILEKQLEYQKDYENLKSQLEEKKKEQEKYIATMKLLWSKYNEYVKEDTKKAVDSMLEEYAKLEDQLRTILALQQATGTAPTTSVAVDGARASGGPVSSGKTYLVGEKGPELFVPSESGTIIPNGVGIGTTININMGGVVVQNEADENRLVDKIREVLTRDIKLSRNFGIA